MAGSLKTPPRLLLVLLLSIAACVQDGGGPGGGSSGEPNPDPPSGTCSGYAFECYHIDEGCGYQEGCKWNFNRDRCSGAQAFCEALTGNRTDCIDQYGCNWKGADGEAIDSLDVGTCAGEAAACDTFTADDSCGDQYGCIWEDDECVNDPTEYGECQAFTPNDDHDIHPRAARIGCEALAGCTWSPGAVE